MFSSHPLTLLKPWPLMIALLLSPSMAHSAEESYENLPITLSASKVLPKAILSGNGYVIDDNVSNDGVQNTYTLDTHFGEFTVTGTEELLSRLQEVEASKALQELENSEEFKEAAKGAATGLVDAGKALVKEPGATTKAAAKGVGRWMRNVGRSIDSEDPHQDNALQTAIGYDAVKRKYAIEMGIDPYTDFEPFQEHLNEVAKAAAAGSMVTSFAINAGTAGSLTGLVVDATQLAKMQNLLKDNPPVSLAEINHQKLLDMGVAEYQSQALLKNYNYTPMEVTLICEALQQMGDIEGREIFVAYATSAPDRQVAHFVRHYAEMLADYIIDVEPGNIVSINGSAWLLSESKDLVGVFPLDYLAWTPNLSKSTSDASKAAKALGARDKKILLTGSFSPQTKAALKERDWELSENIEFTLLPGA